MNAILPIRVGRVLPSGPDLPAFDASRDRLVLIEVRQAAGGMKSFVFAAESGAPFRFLPGQAMTLALPVEGETLHRTFTIASPPTRPERIELTIKAVPGGRATRFMHEALAPSARLKAIGPVGRFTLAHHPAPQLLLASAGSGITPMLSMLRWLADRGEARDVVFLHHGRTPADIPFRAELEAIDRAMPNLTLALSVSEVPPGVSWIGGRGRIERARVRLAVPDLARREVFSCGPEGFTETLRRIHRAEGGEPERFHTESFHPHALPATTIGPGQPPHPPLRGDLSPPGRGGRQSVAVATVPDVGPPPLPGKERSDAKRPGERDGRITIDFDGRPLTATEDETILEAARRQGVSIPTGCRSGVCGTCRVKLVGGEVEMHHQGGLSPREERAGYVLACCSRPRTDVTLVST